jgi:hypothetical protein
MGATEEEADNGDINGTNSLFESGVLSQLSTEIATATFIAKCLDIL